MQPVAIRCQNVAGAWIDTLENCERPARVFFPYVTNLAERALRSNHPQHVEVYTCFDVAAFASGASSLIVVRWLVETGYLVFHLAKLHAKVFEHSASGFATVGSQNLTNGGMKNREATVIIRDPALLGKLKMQLDRWTAKRQPITLEMLADAEPAVAEYRRALKALAGKCRRVEKEIFAAQSKRDEAAREKVLRAAQELLEKVKQRRDEQRLVIRDFTKKAFVFRRGDFVLNLQAPMTVAELAAALKLKTFQLNKILIRLNVFPSPNALLAAEQIEQACEIHFDALENAKSATDAARQMSCTANDLQNVVESTRFQLYQQARQVLLSKLGDATGVPYEVCYYVAYNAQNVKIAGPSRPSRGDANHLRKGRHGWEINLGGRQVNRFGVELAIRWCREELARLFPEDKLRTEMLTQAEKDRLVFVVEAAVIGFNDKPYNGTYKRGADGSLKLGNHYLMPRRTVEAILQISGFNRPILAD